MAVKKLAECRCGMWGKKEPKTPSHPCWAKRDRERQSQQLFASWHWMPGGLCSVRFIISERQRNLQKNFHLFIYMAEKLDAPVHAEAFAAMDAPTEVPKQILSKEKNPGRIAAAKKFAECNCVAREAKKEPKPANNPCWEKRDREPRQWSPWLFASWHWRSGSVCSGCLLSERGDYGHPARNPGARATAKLQSSVNGLNFFHIIYDFKLCSSSCYRDCKAVWHLDKLEVFCIPNQWTSQSSKNCFNHIFRLNTSARQMRQKMRGRMRNNFLHKCIQCPITTSSKLFLTLQRLPAWPPASAGFEKNRQRKLHHQPQQQCNPPKKRLTLYIAWQLLLLWLVELFLILWLSFAAIIFSIILLAVTQRLPSKKKTDTTKLSRLTKLLMPNIYKIEQSCLIGSKGREALCPLANLSYCTKTHSSHQIWCVQAKCSSPGRPFPSTRYCGVWSGLKDSKIFQMGRSPFCGGFRPEQQSQLLDWQKACWSHHRKGCDFLPQTCWGEWKMAPLFSGCALSLPTQWAWRRMVQSHRLDLVSESVSHQKKITKPNEPILHYLYDGPKWDFIREELLVVPANTKLLPPS